MSELSPAVRMFRTWQIVLQEADGNHVVIAPAGEVPAANEQAGRIIDLDDGTLYPLQPIQKILRHGAWVGAAGPAPLEQVKRVLDS